MFNLSWEQIHIGCASEECPGASQVHWNELPRGVRDSESCESVYYPKDANSRYHLYRKIGTIFISYSSIHLIIQFHVMNQVIWNNKNILSQEKSIYQHLFHNCGIVKVGDLVSKDRSFLKSKKVIRAQVLPSQLFSLMGIVNAIPGEWQSIIEENMFTDPHPFNENTFLLPVKGEIVDLLSTSSKTLYKEFCSHKATTPTAQARLNTEYPNLSVELKKIYSLSFNATLDMKLKCI